MKNLNTTGIILILLMGLMVKQEIKAQSFNDPDNNPHDIVYYRPSEQTRPQIKVVYGRPAAHDNEVFGTQIPFGQIWKTGSNESTEIKFYCDVMFGNKFVKAGTYSLYTIPNKDYWIVILNGKTDTYGAHFYDPKYNVATIEVPAVKGQKMENFSIGFHSKSYGTQMVLAWAETRVRIPLYTEERLISKI
ncbi:DUF2911 domain-containing protein [Lutimonas zeaxanthinifaciens]|uniref:DUF2911 domain-containing protein n=1 Tax=Lutimonas zeaxanthinifaciens TaxID=3060215 RepID=UPI00265D2033|nr:DUF2911 domain-containing protein [Lutimonas sp. YSD2104]WKK64719.1 DUF2911 domain-containing protein [Lutimonas sp. YSD2104]